ncbi:hypothetical protein Tco_0051756 [Tanacetum coccineum]
MVEGEKNKESYASEFANSMFNDDDDSGTRIEPKSHKENPKIVVDDDDETEKEKKIDKDDEKENDDEKTDETCSMETRKEKMQTPIPSPTRSHRKNLSSDKTISEELTVTVSPSNAITSKVQSKIRCISSKYSHIPRVIHMMCRQKATDELIEGNLKRVMANTFIQERDALQAEVPALVLKEFVDQAPQIIEELFKNYVDDAFRPHHHDDHQEDDASPEGEKRAKRHKTSKSSKGSKSVKSSSSKQLTNTTPELIDEFQNTDKHIPTIYNYARMMATLNDVMSNQFKDAEEYAYHIEQTKNYMENQIVWESKQEDIKRSKPYAQVFYDPQRNPNEPPRYLYNKDLFFLKHGNTEERSYILSLHKIHVVPFLKDDLEEKLKRWVRKEFKTFNEDARIIEVVRITTDQQHRLDYTEQIIMIRENDKLDSFSKVDFNYLNKNDIEHLYYLCLNKIVNFSHDSYSIMDKPNAGLIYLNNKEEKRVMYLAEIVKLCDATLERVLKEVKLKIFKSEP